MFLNRRSLVAFAVCLCLCSSSALAGGDGGTKRDSTIRVTNNSETPVGVVIDPSADMLNYLQSANPDVAGFTSRGGKIVQPGATLSTRVRAGNHRVIAVSDEPALIGNVTTNVTKGQTVSGSVTDTALTF